MVYHYQNGVINLPQRHLSIWRYLVTIKWCPLYYNPKYENAFSIVLEHTWCYPRWHHQTTRSGSLIYYKSSNQNGVIKLLYVLHGVKREKSHSYKQQYLNINCSGDQVMKQKSKVHENILLVIHTAQWNVKYIKWIANEWNSIEKQIYNIAHECCKTMFREREA